VAGECHDLAFLGVEGTLVALVATFAHPQCVVAWLDRDIGRLLVIDRADILTVDDDVERAASQLDPEARLPTHFERCCHRWPPRLSAPVRILGWRVVVVAQTVSCALAWGHLAQRSDDQVRGNKKLWWFVVTINRGNLIAYWLLGRR
jgi:hypothetical protein